MTTANKFNIITTKVSVNDCILNKSSSTLNTDSISRIKIIIPRTTTYRVFSSTIKVLNATIPLKFLPARARNRLTTCLGGVGFLAGSASSYRTVTTPVLFASRGWRAGYTPVSTAVDLLMFSAGGEKAVARTVLLCRWCGAGYTCSS